MFPKVQLAIGICSTVLLLACTARSQIPESGTMVAGNYRLEVLVNGVALSPSAYRGHFYVAGRVGERYVVRLHNRSSQRVEVVLSVDGRDAMDGQLASYTKRGYLIEPYSHVDVDGFRLSLQEVAAFRFTSIPDSYAARMGDVSSVGMLTAAFFPERYVPPLSAAQPMTRDDDGSVDRVEGSFEARDPARSSADAASGKAGLGSLGESAPSGSAPAKRSRNLGTQFGERRNSQVRQVGFERDNFTNPSVLLSLRYDNAGGLCHLGIARYCPRPAPNPGFSQPPPGWEQLSAW